MLWKRQVGRVLQTDISYILVILIMALSLSCEKTGIRVITEYDANELSFIDSFDLEFIAFMPDCSHSPKNPVVKYGICAFPTTVVNRDDSVSSYPPGSTGVAGVDLAMQDTLWQRLYSTESGTVWPLIGSIGLIDSTVIMSLEDGLHEFHIATGKARYRSYTDAERIACTSISRVRGELFRSLVFTASDNSLFYFQYPDSYDAERNRMIDIYRDVSNDEEVEYTINFSTRSVLSSSVEYIFPGKIISHATTDSSICVHTSDPEMFIEIGNDGSLLNTLLITDSSISSCTLPLAPPYIGHTISPHRYSSSFLYQDGKLYLLHTGIELDEHGTAAILDIEVESGNTVVHRYGSTLHWSNFCGDGSWFVAKEFDLTNVDSLGRYMWHGKEDYVVLQITQSAAGGSADSSMCMQIEQ